MSDQATTIAIDIRATSKRYGRDREKRYPRQVSLTAAANELDARFQSKYSHPSSTNDKAS